MKKIILIFLSILLLTGCYDYVEIENLAIITGLIIDYNNDHYELTTQVLENNSKTDIKVYNTKCKIIDECISQISKMSNKEIFISHLKVMILTENTIKSNKNYYDYFLRNSKSKMNFYVYFIENDIKDKIFDIYKEQNGSSFYLYEMMDFNDKIFSSSSPLLFLDMVKNKLEKKTDTIYPNISIIKNNDKEILYLNKLVSFNNENKKIVLNDKEAIFYNIITNKLNKTLLEIPCDNNMFSLFINYSKTKFKYNKELIINITIKGNINSYDCKYDLDKTKTIELLNRNTSNYIKENIIKNIKNAQNNNIDYYGIKDYIYRHSKNNNINELFKNQKIIVNVNSSIVSLGEMRK